MRVRSAGVHDYGTGSRGNELRTFGNQKLKAVGVIPVRYQSTRLPGKALLKISGKTVLQHVYERSIGCERLDQVIIATDDARIERVAKSLGASCFMSKSRHSCGSERVAEAVRRKRVDIVVNIQGDEVLIRPEMISSAIDVLLSDDEYVCGTLCSPIESDDEFANKDIVKVVLDRDGSAMYFSRSPIPNSSVSGVDAPRYAHVGVYAFRKTALLEFAKLPQSPLEKAESLEQLRILESGMKIKAALTKFKNFSLNRKRDIPIIEQMIQEERR